MKKTICILLLASFASINHAYSQTHSIDSLKRLLQVTKQDSSRSLSFAQIGYEFALYKTDSALYWAEKGLQLASKIHFLRGQGVCKRMIGFILSSTGNEADALQYALDALKIAESTHNQIDMAAALSTLGVIYSTHIDYAKAIEYTLMAKDIARNIHDEHRVMIADLNVGFQFEMIKKYDSAIYYSEQSYDLGVKLDDQLTIGSAMESLGDIYLKMNLIPLAMDNYRGSIPHCKLAEDKADLCFSFMGIAKIFKKEGRDDSALIYSKIAYSTAKEAGLLYEQYTTSSLLADFYKSDHQIDSAFAYLSEVVIVKDSLYNQEKTKKIQSLTMEESLRQQEIAGKKQKADEDAKRSLQLTAVAVFIPVFFLIILFLSRIKVKPRVVEFLAIFDLLLFFEFITDLVFPYIDNWTNDSPLWELAILVVIAALLEPLNYRFENWVKTHLTHPALSAA
jgi:hypothetical protein